MYERKPLESEIACVFDGEVRTFRVKMRPVLAYEMIDFGIRHPFAFGYLTGQGTDLIRQKLVDGKAEVDLSEYEALLRFIWSTIVEIGVDGEPYTGNVDDLPEMMKVHLIAMFRNFNVISQGDVDFFRKLEAFSKRSLDSQNGSE